MQPCIVGDEEIGSRCCRTRKLDRVGSAQRPIRPQPRVNYRRFFCEGDHRGRCRV